MSSAYSLNFNFAYGEPSSSAIFRQQPEDFCVSENLGFEPSGDGEHVYLQVKKRSNNTDWVAKQLAKVAGVSPRDVGFCGLKDRHAVTTQWFSIYQPKSEAIDWHAINDDGIWIEQVSRHQSKLRRGQHRANDFSIQLREVEDIAATKHRLTQVANGVPNYFGEQRFGRGAGNLDIAEQLLVERKTINNRTSKVMAMSAARSYLFNQVLSRRVADTTWTAVLPGDPENVASGPLWGRGRPLSKEDTAVVEDEVLAPHAAWCNGLEHVGLNQERRALLCLPQGFSHEWQGSTLKLGFTLAPGEYATSVLRELVLLKNAQLNA